MGIRGRGKGQLASVIASPPPSLEACKQMFHWIIQHNSKFSKSFAHCKIQNISQGPKCLTLVLTCASCSCNITRLLVWHSVTLAWLISEVTGYLYKCVHFLLFLVDGLTRTSNFVHVCTHPTFVLQGVPSVGGFLAGFALGIRIGWGIFAVPGILFNETKYN